MRNRDCLLSRSFTSVDWGRNPAFPQKDLVAQLVEHHTFNVGVLESYSSGITKLFDIINLGQRRSWRGGTDCNNRVNCHKSLIGNRLEVSGYRTPLQSQSVAVRRVGSSPPIPTANLQQLTNAGSFASRLVTINDLLFLVVT